MCLRRHKTSYGKLFKTRKGIERNRKENFKGNKLLKLMQLSQNAKPNHRICTIDKLDCQITIIKMINRLSHLITIWFCVKLFRLKEFHNNKITFGTQLDRIHPTGLVMLDHLLICFLLLKPNPKCGSLSDLFNCYFKFLLNIKVIVHLRHFTLLKNRYNFPNIYGGCCTLDKFLPQRRMAPCM